MLNNISCYRAEPLWTDDEVIRSAWINLAKQGAPVDIFDNDLELLNLDWAVVFDGPYVYDNGDKGIKDPHKIRKIIAQHSFTEVDVEECFDFPIDDKTRELYKNFFCAIMARHDSFFKDVDEESRDDMPVNVYLLKRCYISITHKEEDYIMEPHLIDGKLLILGGKIKDEGCLGYKTRQISEESYAESKRIDAGYTPDRSSLFKFLKIKEKDPKKISDAQEQLTARTIAETEKLKAEYYDQIFNALNNKLKSLGYDPVDKLVFYC